MKLLDVDLVVSVYIGREMPLSCCGRCTAQTEGLRDVPAQLGQTTGSCQADPNQRNAVVMVTDSCPQCESDHLDLQAIIWSKVSPPGPLCATYQHADAAQCQVCQNLRHVNVAVLKCCDCVQPMLPEALASSDASSESAVAKWFTSRHSSATR